MRSLIHIKKILILILISLYFISCDTTEPPSIQPIDPIPMDKYPDWSPTGEWIAYEHHSVVREGDTTGIYIIRPDGTDKHLIISEGYYPSWSPDGKKIAFSASTYDKQIWIYYLESGIYRSLTSDGFNVNPAWSNQGSKIAYRSDQKIIIVDTSGNILIRTNLGGSFPSWSPNDDSICYNSNAVLTILNLANLTDTTQLFNVHRPKWHPYLSEIVYSLYDYEKKEGAIWIYNLHNKNKVKLLVGGTLPAWSPDGNKIVYSFNKGNKAVLFIINRDGTNNIQLTN
ncbi:translocation protein TolB [bacterium BMS3Abin03]|nr:translocation protein TolB [bacterium BMS3Abin03]